MVIFHADLDNTIIYSHKRDLGTDKINVEIYKEKEISFISQSTRELLDQINEELLLVPTTTRTIEQYNRIKLGIGVPKYALTCNGGVLLVDGERDQAWYEKSLELVSECKDELEKGIGLLEADPARSLDVRYIEELFLFTKSEDPETTLSMLTSHLDTNKVDLYAQGAKIYVVPKALNKGRAILRLREKTGAELVFAAGDSRFDLPMIEAADIGIAPKALAEESDLPEGTVIMPGEKLYAEELLEYILAHIKNR